MFDTMFPLLLVRFCAAAICSFALSVPLSGAEPGGDVGGRSVKITLRSADGTRAQGRLLSCDANGCEIMTDKGQVQGARWADLDLESAVRALRQILADEPTARWSQVVDAFAAQHNLAKLAERMATQVRIREPAAPGHGRSHWPGQPFRPAPPPPPRLPGRCPRAAPPRASSATCARMPRATCGSPPKATPSGASAVMTAGSRAGSRPGRA